MLISKGAASRVIVVENSLELAHNWRDGWP